MAYMRPYPNHFLEEYRKAKFGIPDPPQEVIDMPPYVHQSYPTALYLDKPDTSFDPPQPFTCVMVQSEAEAAPLREEGWKDTPAGMGKTVKVKKSA